MSVNSTIRISSSTAAVIHGFEGVMYLEDFEGKVPFARLAFPETTGASLQVVNISQSTPVTDVVALTRFNTWLLLNDSIRVTVEGETTIKVKGLTKAYPVNFKKIVTLQGLQNFKGTSVPESSVNTKADANGDNFHGTVTVPNRSVVTFELVSPQSLPHQSWSSLTNPRVTPPSPPTSSRTTSAPPSWTT